MKLEINLRIWDTGTDALFHCKHNSDVITIACLCASLTTGLRMLNGAHSNEHRAQTND